MSYDYLLLRVREPARCLIDLTQEMVSATDWYDEGREILRSTFSEFRWSEDAMRTGGDGGHLGTGDSRSPWFAARGLIAAGEHRRFLTQR